MSPSPTPPADRASPGSVARLDVLAGGRFALFADCLLVGLLTAVTALGVITAFPALAAACAVLRDRVVEDRSVTVRRYLRALAEALRAGPAGLLVPPLAGAVFGLDGLALAAGAPGAVGFAVPLALALSAAVVLGLRAAAGWQRGFRWAAVVRRAAREAVRDPGGSALLWLAGVAAGAIVLTVPVTALLIAGPLALAAVALHRLPPATP